MVKTMDYVAICLDNDVALIDIFDNGNVHLTFRTLMWHCFVSYLSCYIGIV
jgi:hypothetical protein